MGNTLDSIPLNPLATCNCNVPDKAAEANGVAFNKVELAASELLSLKFATAYHTSVLVNGEEFFFSDSGIFTDRALNSHQTKPSERIELGYSDKTGTQLLQALQPHFKSGTYDLVRKNCNSFSDCAIYYLLGQRLERRFCALEKLGQANTDLLSQMTKGMYKPNPAVDDFQVEDILGALRQFKDKDDQDDPATTRPKPALMVGSRVTVVGLTKTPELNGQGATVHRYNPMNGRWEAIVHLCGKVKAFRAENLRPAGELVLETGDRIIVRGLKKETGKAHNGTEGEVIRYMHEVSGYEVQLNNCERAISLKAENLQKIET